jgi:hypothetical protein
MSFAPHARLTLYMMFQHRAIFFSNINVLNDPTDCKPYLNYDMDAHNAVGEISSIMEHDTTLSETERQHANMVLESCKSELEEKPALYQADPLEFIRAYTNKRVSDAQVFSMSKKWDEPRMWSHYGSSHRGFCLQLSGLEYVDTGITCSRVDYATRRPCILASEVCSAFVKSNEAAKQQIFNKSFYRRVKGSERLRL